MVKATLRPYDYVVFHRWPLNTAKRATSFVTMLWNLSTFVFVINLFTSSFIKNFLLGFRLYPGSEIHFESSQQQLLVGEMGRMGKR